MKDAEWLPCTDAEGMVAFLEGRASVRKLRLFACACCRRVWDLQTDQRSRSAVEVAEAYADGLAEVNALWAARESAGEPPKAARAAWESAREAADEAKQIAAIAWGTAAAAAHAASYAKAIEAAGGASHEAAWAMAWAVAGDRESGVTAAAKRAELQVQSTLLRCIFGRLPFRPVTVDPDWLDWNGGTVPQIARATYEERAFDRLPVLSDALEEAGCTDADVLGHCRGGGMHVRGCWVVDLIAGKD
jgi:hypothetical protein